jgi:hypothetical protein
MEISPRHPMAHPQSPQPALIDQGIADHPSHPTRTRSTLTMPTPGSSEAIRAQGTPRKRHHVHLVDLGDELAEAREVIACGEEPPPGRSTGVRVSLAKRLGASQWIAVGVISAATLLRPACRGGADGPGRPRCSRRFGEGKRSPPATCAPARASTTSTAAVACA